MSEYQYYGFRAVDRPLNDEQLEYARRQSSRAKVTKWSFDNEYHYGDFRGNVNEMLRRGYDIHFHYADFGIRALMIRLPHGLRDMAAAKPYFDKEGLWFEKDRSGAGGILTFAPFHEPGQLEAIGDADKYLDELVPLREEICQGDLRPFYLAHLSACLLSGYAWDKKLEAPLPPGLGSLTPAQRVLAELYNIDDDLLAAAAEGSGELSDADDEAERYAAWIEAQPRAQKDAWLRELLIDAGCSLRADVLAQFRSSQRPERKAAAEQQPRRTIRQLVDMAERVRADREEQTRQKAAAELRSRLASMAADPAPFIKEAKQLVSQRTTDGYRQASKLLAQVHEALAGSRQAMLAVKTAHQLHEKHPTLKILAAELRKQGLLQRK